jgi:hypothetical protein
MRIVPSIRPLPLFYISFQFFIHYHPIVRRSSLHSRELIAASLNKLRTNSYWTCSSLKYPSCKTLAILDCVPGFNKTGSVRVTWYWDTFVYSMLPWKSNNTCSECVSVALVTQHAMRMPRIILQSVACLILPYYTAICGLSDSAILYCNLWPVWFCHIFPLYLINGTFFRG